MNNVSKEKGGKFESIIEKIYIQIAKHRCTRGTNEIK